MSRRSHRRRAVLAALVATPLSIVLVVGLLTAAWLAGIRLPLASGATWFEVTKVGQVHFSDEPNQPLFFLALGNDGRRGDTVTRGDAIHLIGVNPALHAATIINIPRDTGAEIPGHGVDKINSSNAFGGLSLEAKTVGNLVGVQIPYAITTNFDGFIGMVDDMGGVTVNVPTAMNDSFSGAVFSPGPQHMNGQMALAFSRDRHDFAEGDITRTGNQGLVIISALAQLRAQNTGATGTLHLLAILGRHVQMEGVGLVDLYRLGRLGLSIDPTKVRNVVIPVQSGEGTRLALGAGAQSLFADFADDGVLQTH
jgi:polyisoprenyl-teichoic acid--peptidoglycan teichoic acid transferase